MSLAKYYLNERAMKGDLGKLEEAEKGDQGGCVVKKSEWRSLKRQPNSIGKSLVKPFTLSYIKNFT